ncbi:MAG: hypothetical protein ACRDEB_06150, partial [Chitinophagaceae bacterium]
GGILLLTFWIVFQLQKKKRIPALIPVVTIDPYEEAMKQLELLQQQNPEYNIYHTRLIDIHRRYVFRKKGILSLQKTTTELVVQLKVLNFSKEQFEKLTHALQLSDLVKFAKYIPIDEDDKFVFETILYSIKIIEQSDN